MISIDYLQYKNSLQTQKKGDIRYIYDPIRRKYLVLQPEELVRQLVIQYLIDDRNIRKNLIAVEKLLIVNERRKRCDVLVFNKNEAQGIDPWMLIECKAPNVPINEAVFRQIASYNLPLRVQYLIATNGQQTYCCEMDYEANSFQFLNKIPLQTSTT